jgi:hypothetical protein
MGGTLSNGKKMKRSISVSDFRRRTVEIILENELLKMQSLLNDFDKHERNHGHAVHLFNTPTKKYSSSPLAQQQVGRMRSDSSASRGGEFDGKDGSSTTSWLKAKGREQMAKAKAKFAELKNKHFEKLANERNSLSESQHGAGASTHGNAASGNVYDARKRPSLTHMASSSGGNTTIERRESESNINTGYYASQQHLDRSQTEREGVDGAGQQGHTSKLGKYVASIFGEKNTGAGEGLEQSEHTSSSMSQHGGSASAGSATGGRRESFWGKAISSMRQHMEKDS